MIPRYVVDGVPTDRLTTPIGCALKPGEMVVVGGKTIKRTDAVFRPCPDCCPGQECDECGNTRGRWACDFCDADWEHDQTTCPCELASIDLEDLRNVAQ